MSALASVRADREGGASRADHDLVVASPAFDRRLFPSLAELSGTEAEVDSVRRLGMPTIALTGAGANPESILRALPGSRFVEMATHAIWRTEGNGGAALVTATSTVSPTGLLAASQIESTDLTLTRLVVLAGCSTASGRARRSGGGAGLARAFLGAGAWTVVASVADVDDEALRQWQKEFRERASNVGASSALAQLADTELLATRSRSSRRLALALETATPGLQVQSATSERN